VGTKLHDPSAPVTFNTVADCTAYRQPSGPAVTKSPRVPLATMSVRVGGLAVRSTLVILPSLRLTNRTGLLGSVPAATPMPSPVGTVAIVETAPGVALVVPPIRYTVPLPAA
jgi:hypothetical protein